MLDLLSRRYPGTRPSDLYGRKSPDNPDGLDDYQAFQLDAALAYRYNALEEEDEQEKLNFIMNGIRAIMRTMGNKQAKPEKFHKTLGKTTDADMQRQSFFGSSPAVKRGDVETP